MDSIRITNDEREMISIAEKMINEHANKYSESVMEEFREYVRSQMPDASAETIENTVYRTIYYYWAYGCSMEEYFLYRFYEKTYEEIKEYVTIREKVIYIDHISNPADMHILNNKYETYQKFKPYYKRDVILCRNEEDYPAFRRLVEKSPEFVIKPTALGCGHGVRKASVAGMSETEIRELYDALFHSFRENSVIANRAVGQTILIEELINQDETMAAFHPASANGVRATTVRIGDNVTLYQPWIKVGRGGNFVTSVIYGTMDAAINAKTGIVETPAMTTRDRKVFDRHPDSGIQFVGFQIPRWDELVGMVTEMAKQLPTLGYVGWDMVLTPNGWCVMEGNARGDFMWQLMRNRGMKKEFEDLIGWKMDREFWWQPGAGRA